MAIHNRRGDGDGWQPDDRVAIAIVGDPGLATGIASMLVRALPHRLERLYGDRLPPLDIRHETMGLPPSEGGEPLLDQWRDQLTSEVGEVVLCLSEIPRRIGPRPVVAEISHSRLGVVYLPALGTFAVRRRALSIATETVAHMLHLPVADRKHHQAARHQWTCDRDHNPRAVGSPVLGRARIVAGMIRANRPWRLVPTLTGALAAASAASAFGVFYSSIWQMAAAMSSTRLAMVTVVAVAAMTIWLIVPNHMWERSDFRAAPTDRVLYNAATLGTVAAGVACMYLLLFVVVLAAGLVVVSPHFLTEQLGHHAGLVDYLRLAWLAASLGTVAGAVGSSTADTEDILRATYGHRELQRRQHQPHPPSQR